MAFKTYKRGDSPCKTCFKGNHSKCKKMEYCSCDCPNPFKPRIFVNQNRYKTHCLRGHELNINTIYLKAENRRICIKCVKIRRENNKEKVRLSAREHYQRNKHEISMLRRLMYPSLTEKLKREILFYYGNNKLSCVCCGETEFKFLTIDHIDNNGSIDRKNIRRTGHNLYRYLKKMKLPIGYQTLCFNCNSGKQINKGICPHKMLTKLNIHTKWMAVN